MSLSKFDGSIIKRINESGNLSLELESSILKLRKKDKSRKRKNDFLMQMQKDVERNMSYKITRKNTQLNKSKDLDSSRMSRRQSETGC